MKRIALCFMLWLLCGSAFAAEQRVALVIGNAAYRVDPLDNPVNDARLVASSLKQAGFDVTLAENLDRRGLQGALRTFGERLNDNTVAVLYYAGHGLQLRDRNYLIPVDAEIRSEDEIALAGIDLSFILARMSAARSRVNIVILDACRNNPFAGKGGSTAQGLAPMDAPVGTLLAYATAPGKLAADGLGGPNDTNGLYAHHLARQLLTPGMPVEHVFKRVREHVVRATGEAQVPWESSSLQGEFAFVPGAIIGVVPVMASAAPVTTPPMARRDALPREGDRWRYRISDQFRLGDVFVSAKVEKAGADGITESWTTTADAKLRTTHVALAPAFNALPDWSIAPPEFAPYLLAAGALAPQLRAADWSREVEHVNVPLRASVERDEDVQVPAGRFRAQKVVLRGSAPAAMRGGAARASVVSIEHRLWYASEAKRIVKHEVSVTVGGVLRQATTFELVDYQVR